MIRGRGGQSAVEMLIVLPVFMMMLFVTLELGNIAYHTILAHHAAYELARVGALVGVKKAGGPTNKQAINSVLKDQASQMFSRTPDKIRFETELRITSMDPQNPTHANEDLIVKIEYPVKLIFPGTNIFLADPPKRLGFKTLRASVRMPVERPLLN